MTPDVIESIKSMVVNNNRLELPKGHMANYAAVKRVLIKAGGKYVKNGFAFSESADEIKTRLTGGEKIDDKKKFQFFPTPKDLAIKMVAECEFESHHRVLEPSAGNGNLAMMIPPWVDELLVVEIDEKHIELLAKYYQGIHDDFLTITEDEIGLFDRIIANPPFTNNQDIDHVYHMYKFLKPGGRLVSVMSKSWTFGSQKKQIKFREWLENIDGEMEDIDSGVFKESGTNVATVLVIINKPQEIV